LIHFYKRYTNVNSVKLKKRKVVAVSTGVRLQRLRFPPLRYFSNIMGGWEEEKTRKLNLSLEERRKEYSCGDNFKTLADLQTWKLDSLYQQKLNKEKNTLNDKEMTAVEKAMEGFTLKDIDLSEKVSLFVGDITQLEIDAIVNAANNSLLGGGGVDGAIHRAAGRQLLEENKTHNGCQDGEAKISGGYNLPAKYVISTVGPRGAGDEVLKAAYQNSLDIMLQNNLKSIAFPCISTGIYGFPNDRACLIALQTARRFLEEHHEVVDRVIFCLFLKVDVVLYNKFLPYLFPATTKSDSSGSV